MDDWLGAFMLRVGPACALGELHPAHELARLPRNFVELVRALFYMNDVLWVHVACVESREQGVCVYYVPSY